MVSSVAMIAITTSSSSSVKPRRDPKPAAEPPTASGHAGGRLPVTVRNPVEPGARRARTDVVDVVARLRIVRWARVRAQPPRLRGRRGGVGPERIARQASQEVDLEALLGAGRVLDPVDQHLQVGRIAALVELLLDAAGVRGGLVGV